MPYPEGPPELTDESVADYVEAYERAYQYNATLADHPERIGVTNGLDVSINERTVERADGRFAVTVVGQLNFNIRTDDATPSETRTSPTPTPLPISHKPFETEYEVSARRLRRRGTTVECW